MWRAIFFVLLGCCLAFASNSSAGNYCHMDSDGNLHTSSVPMEGYVLVDGPSGAKKEAKKTLNKQETKPSVPEDPVKPLYGTLHCTRGGVIGCAFAFDFENVLRCQKNQDEEAIEKILKGGRCFRMKDNVPVYVDEHLRRGWLIKLRAKGSPDGFWTDFSAIANSHYPEWKAWADELERKEKYGF
ncbi:MAG: hypothetical protein AB2L11_09415 [Syntrophobacteraceae bacterium]